MDITCLARCTLQLPSGAIQEFPAGWSGKVDDQAAVAWIKAGFAALNPTIAPPGQQFTEAQAAVLAAAADQAMAEADTIVAAAVAPTEPATDLSGLNVAQLREIAASRGLQGYAKLSKSALIEQLSR